MCTHHFELQMLVKWISVKYSLHSDLQIQLIRIQLRVPEIGWTTQKVFHLMNFIVNGGNVLS